VAEEKLDHVKEELKEEQKRNSFFIINLA